MQPFVQHPGKVAEAGNRFAHVMALTLDPKSENRQGIIRCVTSRTAEAGTPGSRDHSVLHHISGTSLEQFEIGEPVFIEGEAEMTQKLKGRIKGNWDYLGLEDPDIWTADTTGEYHLYFTIPFVSKHRWFRKDRWSISLGHAQGLDLHSLVMTEPSLFDEICERGHFKAKEVCIAPPNSQGVRLNLVESGQQVRVALAQEMGKPWRFGPVAFDATRGVIPWAAHDASPAPLLPSSFIEVGLNKRVGILNGHTKAIDGSYGTFSIGLFIYDYEKGIIDWISPQPLIQDTEAKVITFASHFVETKLGEGILYAHVDDSFVRAYTLYAEGIRALLPK